MVQKADSDPTQLCYNMWACVINVNLLHTNVTPVNNECWYKFPLAHVKTGLLILFQPREYYNVKRSHIHWFERIKREIEELVEFKACH